MAIELFGWTWWEISRDCKSRAEAQREAEKYRESDLWAITRVIEVRPGVWVVCQRQK